MPGILPAVPHTAGQGRKDTLTHPASHRWSARRLCAAAGFCFGPEHGVLTALLVDELASTDADRLDQEELAEAFRELDFETGMKAASLWPEGWE